MARKRRAQPEPEPEPAWEDSLDVASMVRRVLEAGLDDIRSNRLLACAIGRLVWNRLPEGARRAIEVSERFADGRATWEDLRSALAELSEIVDGNPTLQVFDALMLYDFSIHTAVRAVQWNRDNVPSARRERVERAVCNLIREIYGNPTRPRHVDPDWLTPAVVDLARDIHENRSFDQMPMLGDALEEAGCSDRAMLDHCRGPNKHVRGCWVLDPMVVPNLTKYRPPKFPWK